MIRRDARQGLAKINKLQAKEYQELFPPTCDKSQTKIALPGNILEQFLNREVQTDAHPDIGNRSPFQEEIVQEARLRQGGWRTPQDEKKVDPTQLSARRHHRRTDLPPNRLLGKEHRRSVCGRGQAPDKLASWLPSHADHKV
jgi:hypothetical protein